VHNIRIERLWVDVMTGYISKWADLFTDLERHHGLDIESDNHVWLLHYLYLGLINEDALKWGAAWNQHPMRLPNGQSGGRSPINQYIMGLAEQGLRGTDDKAYEEEGEEYGIDWDDLENGDLVRSILTRRGETAEQDDTPTIPAAGPPRWSRVEVDSPTDCPISRLELQELEEYVCCRVDTRSIRMDVRRNIWIHAIQYFNQLLAQNNE
jgi:hypothetical protein